MHVIGTLVMFFHHCGYGGKTKEHKHFVRHFRGWTHNTIFDQYACEPVSIFSHYEEAETMWSQETSVTTNCRGRICDSFYKGKIKRGICGTKPNRKQERPTGGEQVDRAEETGMKNYLYTPGKDQQLQRQFIKFKLLKKNKTFFVWLSFPGNLHHTRVGMISA